MTSFDADVAKQARDQAIERVDKNTDSGWKQIAATIIYWLALTRQEFTTDAIWYLLGKLEADPPHEQRALGAVVQQAAKEGWIAKTDRVSPSVRPKCHARPLAVWRSLIFREEHLDESGNVDTTALEKSLLSSAERARDAAS